MTYSELKTEIRFLTGTDSNSFTNDDLTRLLNSNYHKVVTMILKYQDEWDFDDINHTDYPILTTSLVANQQDYTLPVAEKVLKIKRLEVSYDGTNWYKIEPFDINQRGRATDTTSINNYFQTTKPYYDIQYNAIWLYPIPTAASANGLKIWWAREIDEFVTSDTTQEPGIDEPFHKMLSYLTALDFGIAKGKANVNQLVTIIRDYEYRLKEYYGAKQTDRNYLFNSVYSDTYGE